ncbi:hypothetical protein [Euzebya sp.]|uniref:hypothetical protein n=1 Tax=Euzebya sp. TaxID=1971409 RepID=UPI0035144EA4
MAYKLPNPERERTERNRELKRLRTKTDPGRERAERAAELAVWFHDERSINHVMELAQLVLDDVDDGVEVLLDAYLDDVRGVEDQMERLAMLANVGRWIDEADLEAAARARGADAAARWTGAVGDEIERAERLTVVERRFDAELREAVQRQLA